MAQDQESQPSEQTGQAEGVTGTSPRRWRRSEGFDQVLIGPNGLRAGWSIVLFYAFFYIFRLLLGTIGFSTGIISDTNDNSALAALTFEFIPFLALLGAAALMAQLEHKSILAYNLSGPRRARNFAIGLCWGFLILSILVLAMMWSGWLQFEPTTLTKTQVVGFGSLWGCAFLVVGSLEEGLFRCYALSTLARGINFWWALATEVVICADVYLRVHGNGAFGVYLMAALGLPPCLLLQQKQSSQGAFWSAAWVTSTVFALYHTANNGENWIGIFAAGSIGFVFCASVRLTGSAWWAIGFHAAWDWAETFFYGTADSGMRGQGHLLTANPHGNPLWSGGDDGPEGSLLVLGVILLLPLLLLLIYPRRSGWASAADAAQPSAS
jgi:uncharacterized protein